MVCWILRLSLLRWDSATEFVEVTATGDPTALEITLTDSVLGLGRSTTGTVALGAAAPVGGLEITLLIDDATIAGLSPTTVTIPAGSTSADFTVNGLAEGTTTIRANGAGLAEATASVEVSELAISVDPIPNVAPGESTSLVVSIVNPAPPQGLVINLEVFDPGVVSVSTATLNIPAGARTPIENVQLTGFTLGETTVRATAPGYSPDQRDVRVTIAAAFSPTSITVPETLTRSLVIIIDAPAPTGGVTFALNVDDGALASVPASITIPAGQTQTPTIAIDGIGQGSTVLRATTAGIGEITADVTVTALPQARITTTSSTTQVPEIQVGLDLMWDWATYLEQAPAEPVDIVLSVPPGSGVLLSSSCNSSLVSTEYTIRDAVTVRPGGFCVHGVELGDDVPLTLEIVQADPAAPPIYAVQESTVDIDPTGVWFNHATLDRDVFGANLVDRVSYGVVHDAEGPGAEGTLRQSQIPRPGANLEFVLASSDPTVAALVENSVFPPVGVLSVSYAVDPLAGGTTTIGFDTLPPGFAPAVGRISEVLVTIDPSEVRFGTPSNTNHFDEFEVGRDLQRAATLFLESAPPGPVDVRVSVPANSGILLSTSATEVGTDQVSFLNETRTRLPFWVQGVELGDDVPVTIEVVNAGTATPAGYTILATTIDVDPTGLAFVSTSLIETTIFADPTDVAADFWMLYDDEDPRDGQSRTRFPTRPGAGLSIGLLSSNGAAALLVDSPLIAHDNSGRITFEVDPVGAGTTTLVLDLPPGIATPTDRVNRPNMTVTAPMAWLTDLSRRQLDEVIVGQDLQSPHRIELEDPAPVPVDIVVSVPAGSGVLLSTDALAAGSDSITMSLVTSVFSPDFYVQGTAIGDDVDVTIEMFETGTANRVGYDVQPTTVDVDPSGVAFLTSSLTLTTFSPDGLGLMRIGNLYDDEGPGTPGTLRNVQPVRGGFTIPITAQSSDPTVAALVDQPVEFVAGESRASFAVDPLTSGTSVITILTLPPGLVIAQGANAQVNVTVDAPDTTLRQGSGIISSTQVGAMLQEAFTVRLEQLPPNPVDVTITVADGSSALVSADQNALGAASITFPAVTALSTPALFLQGVAEGTATQLRITAPGYDDWIVDVSVVGSGFAWRLNSLSVTAPNSASPQIGVAALNSNGTRIEFQQLRGDLGVIVDLTSSIDLVLTTDPTVTAFGGEMFWVAPVTGVTPGLATVEITQPPGFSPVAGGSELSVTVN